MVLWLELFSCDPCGNRLSRLISDLELNAAVRLQLRDRHLGRYVASLGNIANAKLDEVACAQVAVYGQVKQNQVPRLLNRSQTITDSANLFQSQRQLPANQFALVPRTMFGFGLGFGFGFGFQFKLSRCP